MSKTLYTEDDIHNLLMLMAHEVFKIECGEGEYINPNYVHLDKVLAGWAEAANRVMGQVKNGS